MPQPHEDPITAQGYASLLILQHHLLHTLVRDLVSAIHVHAPQSELSRIADSASVQAGVLSTELPPGEGGMPDFGPIADLFDASTGWHLKRSLELSLVHAAKKRLAAQFPGLVSIETELTIFRHEQGERETCLDYVTATFDGGHYISFKHDVHTNSGPFGLVLYASSADNTVEAQGRAHDARLLGAEPTDESMQERMRLLTRYLEVYFSHEPQEPGLQTVYERH